MAAGRRRMIEIGIDGDGQVSHWSRGAEAVSGFLCHEVLGLRFVRHFVDSDRPESITWRICQAWLGLTVPHLQVPILAKSGERLYLLLSPVLQWNKARREHHVVLTGCVQTSNTSRRVSVDSRGGITDWGDRVAALLGFRSDEVLGLNFVDSFVAPDHRDAVFRRLDQALGGEKVLPFDLRIKSRSAVEMLFELQVEPCCIRGQVVGAVFVLTEGQHRRGPDKRHVHIEAMKDKFEERGTQDTISTCLAASQDTLLSMGHSEDRQITTRDTLTLFSIPSMDFDGA